MIGQLIHKPKKKPLVCLVAIMLIITINCGKINTVSDELIGIWKSCDFRYNDSSFEIDKKAITFHTKEGNIERFAIVEIKKKAMPDNDWIQYTIFYRNQDLQKVEFPFYFRPSQNSLIRFKNQPSLVWKKESSIVT